MRKPFYERLQSYFADVSAVLRGESAAAAMFPNASDIGSSRERVYCEFLRRSLPSACNVLLGGFVFNQDGQESGQIDIIVTTDSCPRFDFLNRDGFGKSFCCIDGTLAAISVKSTLNKATLHDAIANLATLPRKTALTQCMASGSVALPNYDDWPYKVVFASSGASADTIEDALFSYFDLHPTRVYASPNLIHVAGEYSLVRTGSEPAYFGDGKEVPPHTWVTEIDRSDAGALSRTVVEIQTLLMASRYINFDYRRIVGSFRVPIPPPAHTVICATEYYGEHIGEGQPPQGMLDSGQLVRLLEKYGEFSLVELSDGSRVQVRTASLGPTQAQGMG